MEKLTWTAIIFDGKIDEYIKRHDKIWNSLKDVFELAGITNYSINILWFKYYEILINIYTSNNKNIVI